MREAFVLREHDVLSLARNATGSALVIYAAYLELHPDYVENFKNAMAKVKEADELLNNAYAELFKIQAGIN